MKRGGEVGYEDQALYVVEVSALLSALLVLYVFIYAKVTRRFMKDRIKRGNVA